QDVTEVLILLVVQLTEEAFQQYLGESDHRVQRGPQLVRHAGQEIGLVLAHHLELGALLLQLAEQLGVVDRHRRLAGKGPEDLQRLIGKLSRRAPANHESTDDAPIAKDRYSEHGPPAVVVQDLKVRVEVDKIQVGDGDGVAFARCSPDQGAIELDSDAAQSRQQLGTARVRAAH